jgi:hypothetical protein
VTFLMAGIVLCTYNVRKFVITLYNIDTNALWQLGSHIYGAFISVLLMLRCFS